MLEVIKRANRASEDLELVYVEKEKDLYWEALVGYLKKPGNYCFNIMLFDECIGNLILSMRPECGDGVFIEYLYIHKDYRGNGLGKLMADYLKETFDEVYGESEPGALPFWQGIGAEILNDNNLFVY
mgnify:CR=1 FL=1